MNNSQSKLSHLVVNKYRDAFKHLGIPQNYPFLSSGYCEELCIYIRSLKERAETSEARLAKIDTLIHAYETTEENIAIH